MMGALLVRMPICFPRSKTLLHKLPLSLWMGEGGDAAPGLPLLQVWGSSSTWRMLSAGLIHSRAPSSRTSSKKMDPRTFHKNLLDAYRESMRLMYAGLDPTRPRALLELERQPCVISTAKLLSIAAFNPDSRDRNTSQGRWKEKSMTGDARRPVAPARTTLHRP